MEAYFAYGSNLCPNQFRTRCPSAVIVSAGVVRGRRLTFPRRCTGWQRGGVAGIEPHDPSHVEGALYHLHPDDLPALDDYEGVDLGHYVRTRIQVETRVHGPVEAWSYDALPEPGGPFAPSTEYVQTMLRGAREHGLSTHLIEFLSNMLPVGAR